MTPRITLITVPVLAALALAPAGFGKGQLPTATTSPDVVERAVAAKLAQESPIVSPDAVDRVRVLRAALQPTPITPPDAFERAAAARADYGSNRVFDDRFNAPAKVTNPTLVTSGDEIEWPQVGIGFVLGILLASGLYAGMRLGHARPLAHR
jgi:hypothetical protein